MVLKIRDVTEEKRLGDKLPRLALHDPLTGLPNHPLFLDRLGFALQQQELRNDEVAVDLLDRDRFKTQCVRGIFSPRLITPSQQETSREL
jgi:GGDEF domain-containing protein